MCFRLLKNINEIQTKLKKRNVSDILDKLTGIISDFDEKIKVNIVNIKNLEEK